MRIVANQGYIARGAFVGRYASLVGLSVLVAAFIFSWTRTSSLVTMQLGLAAALLLGVLLSFIGGHYADRFGPGHAHHLAVRNSLKGLDDRYVLFQYVLPAPHVLLGPDGLTVLVVRSQPGEVAFSEGRWHHRQRGKFLRLMAGQEGLGLPEADLEREVARITRALQQVLPAQDVPVRGVVVFTHPDVQLDLRDPPVPILHARKLKAWLRGPGAGRVLPAHLRQQLEERLARTRTKRDHS